MSASSVQPGAFDAVLNALASGAGGYFGDPNAVLSPIQRFERPFSSLLRVRVQTTAGESHAFVKIFKGRQDPAHLRRQLENEYRMTLRLHEAFTSRPGLAALRPVAMFPEQLAIVTAEVPGQTFDRLVRGAVWGFRSASQAIEAARRVGAWVRTYQAVTPPQGKVTAGREYLDVRLRALVGPVLRETDRAFALRAHDALTAAGGDGAASLAAMHGDLSPTNIIVQPTGEITILDFTSAKTGMRYHDIAHLFLHLHFEASRMPLRRGFLRTLQRALLAEFDPDASADEPAFKLMLLQHCACHIALLVERSSGRGRLTFQRLDRQWRRYIPLWAPHSVS